MKKLRKILYILMMIIMINNVKVYAHGGNITGWKDKNSDKIIYHEGKNFGYHKQDGKLHYHEVEWNESKQKWEIIKTAVYYDENFNVININDDKKTEKVQVKYIEKVDGDTAKFELNGENITVRFLGIDTPETVHPTKGEEPFGKEASNFSEEKLKNATKIELEYDNNADKTDKYERHLAWIWVDDILLQTELVKEGLAKTYMLQDNYKYAGVLQENEEFAKKQQLKIWSGETTEKATQTKEIQNTNPEKTIELEISENLFKVIIAIMLCIIGCIMKSFKKIKYIFMQKKSVKY